jgi:hypothetical protein
MIEATIKVRAPDNWFEITGVRYTVAPANYGLVALVASINDAILASGASLALMENDQDAVGFSPADADPWTLDAGRGILEMLGLETHKSGTLNIVGDYCRGRMRQPTDTPPGTLTIRRQFGMQPKFASQHNHRARGTVAWGQQRAEDVLMLDFPEADAGLWCRFLDQVAAGLLVVGPTSYFLMDDSVALTRVNGVLRAELTLVEV